jgi:endonuclease/exonuclease/phosphatase (EEP) superfamily protein YafD
MKPIALRLWFSGDRLTLRDGHQRRIGHYEELMGQIEEQCDALAAETVILAGDFNVGADMQSLAPVRERLRDVWLTHGTGWGGTALSSFPVARIDHCWVSADIQPISARVISTEISDHRPLVVELIVPDVASGQ